MHDACCTGSTYGPAIVTFPARMCGRGSHIPETLMQNKEAPMFDMLHCDYILNIQFTKCGILARRTVLPESHNVPAAVTILHWSYQEQYQKNQGPVFTS